MSPCQQASSDSPVLLSVWAYSLIRVVTTLVYTSWLWQSKQLLAGPECTDATLEGTAAYSGGTVLGPSTDLALLLPLKEKVKFKGTNRLTYTIHTKINVIYLKLLSILTFYLTLTLDPSATYC